MCFLLSICLSVFGVLITPELMNRSLLKILWVGPGPRKKLLIFGKDLDHILVTKIMNFHRSHFNVF